MIHTSRTMRAALLGLTCLAAPAAWAQAPATPTQTDAAAKAAADAKANIDVTDAWTRATPGGSGNAAIYLRIVNLGKEADILVGAKTENAAKVDLHNTVMEGGTAKMSPLASLVIPGGQTINFAPGGRHVMLTGLKAPLKEGESFFAKLIFKNAGEETLVVKVLGAGATGLPVVKPKAGDMTSGVSR
jgi:copper(I)-binding protein